MATRFNYSTDNGFTMERFASVCVKAGEGFNLFKQTETIYKFLVAHKGEEFSPTEIGLALGRSFVWHNHWDDTDEPYVKRISDSLYWLYNLGLINRNTYTQKITVDLGYKQRVRDVKVIDGVEYVGYIYKDTMEVDSTSYKWFAM